MSAAVRPESAEESAAVIVRQPNGGALLSGGKRGNKGGGRKPDAIRRMARAMLAERMPVLGQIADGVAVRVQDKLDEDGFPTGESEWKLFTPSPKDRVSALKVLGDLGMGASMTSADVHERLRTQIAIMREMLPPELFEALARRLSREVWK